MLIIIIMMMIMIDVEDGFFCVFIASGEMVVKEHFWFKTNQFYVIHLESWLESGEYIIKMVFKADLKSDLGGFYRMEYKRNDGTIT